MPSDAQGTPPRLPDGVTVDDKGTWRINNQVLTKDEVKLLLEAMRRTGTALPLRDKDKPWQLIDELLPRLAATVKAQDQEALVRQVLELVQIAPEALGLTAAPNGSKEGAGIQQEGLGNAGVVAGQLIDEFAAETYNSRQDGAALTRDARFFDLTMTLRDGLRGSTQVVAACLQAQTQPLYNKVKAVSEAVQGALPQNRGLAKAYQPLGTYLGERAEKRNETLRANETLAEKLETKVTDKVKLDAKSEAKAELRDEIRHLVTKIAAEPETPPVK